MRPGTLFPDESVEISVSLNSHHQKRIHMHRSDILPVRKCHLTFAGSPLIISSWVLSLSFHSVSQFRRSYGHGPLRLSKRSSFSVRNPVCVCFWCKGLKYTQHFPLYVSKGLGKLFEEQKKDDGPRGPDLERTPATSDQRVNYLPIPSRALRTLHAACSQDHGYGSANVLLCHAGGT